MTKLFSLVAILFVCTTLNFSCGTADTPAIKETKTATPEELSQMNKDFAKALVAKDAVAAAKLYTTDASLLPPGEAIVKGRADIEKYWKGVIDAGLTDGSVTTIATGSNGDLGYEIGHFELTFKDSSGKITIDKGKYTELLQRDSSGKWLSIYGMWNADPTASK